MFGPWCRAPCPARRGGRAVVAGDAAVEAEHDRLVVSPTSRFIWSKAREKEGRVDATTGRSRHGHAGCGVTRAARRCHVDHAPGEAVANGSSPVEPASPRDGHHSGRTSASLMSASEKAWCNCPGRGPSVGSGPVATSKRPASCRHFSSSCSAGGYPGLLVRTWTTMGPSYSPRCAGPARGPRCRDRRTARCTGPEGLEEDRGSNISRMPARAPACPRPGAADTGNSRRRGRAGPLLHVRGVEPQAGDALGESRHRGA